MLNGEFPLNVEKQWFGSFHFKPSDVDTPLKISKQTQKKSKF